MNEPPQKPDPNDLTERTLGEFRLLRRLGRGGMAEVFLADQTSLSRHVAIKVLRPENTATMDDDVVLKRFQQEAKAAAGLSHPNIVQVYSIGEEDGLHYIAQEYVEGINLADYIKRNGPPDAAIATHLLRQIASALKVASEAGIVHRDIKPENIMLTQHGDAKVADFGLAQLTQGTEKLNLTQAGTTMGTPLYMSPEQVNGKKLDHRSDIYSFGVTAYHMLAGRPPFQGETAMSVAVQHLKDEPASLSVRRADLPRALCDTIHKMLAKDPSERPQTAAEVLLSLDSVAGSLGTQTIRFNLNPAGSDSLLSRLFNSHRRKNLVRAILGIVVVGAMAAGIGRYLRPEKRPESSGAMIPVQDSAREQFMFALSLPTPNVSAWNAVILNFPDSLAAKRAISQLGKLYIDQVADRANPDWRKAREQYNLLEKLGKAGDKESLIKGLAGLAYIDSMEAKFTAASRKIDLLQAKEKRLDVGSIEFQLLSDARELIEKNDELDRGDGPTGNPPADDASNSST
jgi:serine/threonine protein kinase